MKEKRRFPRFSVDSMNIHGKILFSNNVKILNISAGGTAFKTEKKLNTGGVYILRIENKGKLLHMRGRVVWSRQNTDQDKKGESPGEYMVGMKFLDVSDSRMHDIGKFIRDNYIDYQPMHSKSRMMGGIRIHVRFTIHDPESVAVRYAENYTVKKISRCGMQIESASALRTEDIIPMEMSLSKSKAVALWGRIVTCKQSDTASPPHYDVGIEFMDISEKDMSTLKTFISSLDQKTAI